MVIYVIQEWKTNWLLHCGDVFLFNLLIKKTLTKRDCLMDNMLRQYQLEEEMLGYGVEKFRKDLQDNNEKGLGANNITSKELMSRGVEPLSKAIREYTTEALKGKAGNNNKLVMHTKNVNTDQLAFLTLKLIFDVIVTTPTLQGVSTAIGQGVEDQINHDIFKKENTGLFRVITRDLNKRTSNTRHKRRVLRHSAGKAKIGIQTWSIEVKHQIGMKLIDLAIQSTGFFHIKKPSAKKPYNLMVTQEVSEWINERNVRCELMSPFRLPMLAVPKDWTTIHNGGYFSKPLKMPLVKSRNKGYLKDLNKVHMPEVYDCVNHLQQTPWRINQDIYEIMNEAMKLSNGLGKLPQSEDLPMPVQPPCLRDTKGKDKSELSEEQIRALNKWKREAAHVHSENTRRRSKLLSLMKQMWVAEKYFKEERFYFVYQYDFRGRIYPVQKFLNPQGQDTAKGLLEFSEGKAIETEEQAAWLAIHGANLFGYDKDNLQGRASWIMEHKDQIDEVANDPLGCKWWTKADKPWQFLAFCLEFSDMMKNGLPFVSHIPVAVDATCSGIQHFSAILRDEEGGEAVNLLPNEERQDIYQRVADVMNTKLAHMDDDIAKQWVGKVDRGLIKRNVMTMPYSATLMGMRDQLLDTFKEYQEKGKNIPEMEDPNEHAGYLSKLSNESIGDVVKGASTVMDYLQEVAAVANKDKLPLIWQTPVGFPVRQEYKEPNMKRIDTYLHGKFKITSSLCVNEKGINKRRQVSGVSPNFVHSMDAAMLVRTVVGMQRNNVTSLAMVHDSYGTHASDIPLLNEVLRSAFVEVHTESNTLKNLVNNVQDHLKPELISLLPQPPETGSLDLETVKSSEFFFS